MPHLVRDRKDLRKVLEYSLLPSEEPEVEFFSFEDEDSKKDINKPKTFVIESNLDSSNPFDGLQSPMPFEIKPSEDPTLVNFIYNPEVTASVFYVDTQDPRFWVIHSTGDSGDITGLLRKLVQTNDSHLDFPWLPTESLGFVRSLGRDTGFRLGFEQRFDEEEDALRVKIGFWGRNVPAVLDAFGRVPGMGSALSLHSVGIEHGEESGYVRETVTNFGKFTLTKGDSIDGHFHLVRRVREHYRQIIEHLEERYRLRYGALKGRGTLTGDFVTIKFFQPLEERELLRFAEVLTSPNSVFKIWGLWKQISPQLVKVKAIDLHTMQRFEGELTPSELRIFLTSDSCANILTRLLTNIQSGFDSRCSLLGDANERLITPYVSS